MNDHISQDVVVFAEALLLPANHRAAYVEHACGNDKVLCQRVKMLLNAHERAGGFLEQSPQESAMNARREASVLEQPGDRIGRYKLLQQIGEGGCGIVYMAEQEGPVRRRVALKIIKPGMDTKSVVARFEAERQALALMDHPNIAKVFDAGATESGRPYFVMELIRGVKITEYCNEKSLTTEERLKLFVQVCQAVQHAHQKGIIHRDIKPSNILVTTTLDGVALPLVIDFGIAKATTSQKLTDKTLFTAFEMLIGTPAYMSPEQAALTSVDVDTRSDIYSLGVLLYELLTGTTPFDTGELLKAGLDEIRRVIREQEPVPPSTKLSKLTEADLTTVARQRKLEPPRLIRAVCGDLDWIVMKTLEKDCARRYATANDLVIDVQRFLANETISARPPSTSYKFQKMVLRNKYLCAGIGIIALLLVTSLIVVSASLARVEKARREMETDKQKALIEAAKSKEVTQFLENMLQGVGPSVARGRDTAMLREILDRTAGSAGNQLTNQPAVEAELLEMIGRLYFEIGTYDSAEKMERLALAINIQLSGSESTESAITYNDLGRVLVKEGNLTEAERFADEALAIRRRRFGDENPDTADSLDNVATVYRIQRKLTQSEALIRESLVIRRKLFGNESLEVADSLHNLCVILGDQGKDKDAESTAREFLAIRQKLLKSDDPLVASALSDVAWVTDLNGKYGEAQSFAGEALGIQRHTLGDGHPETARSIAFLGEIMQQRGKLSEADAVLSAAISIQCKLVGEDNPDTLYSFNGLGVILEQEGKWAEAEQLRRKTLALWRKRAGNEDPQTLWQMQFLVQDLVAQKHYGEAEQILGETLTPTFVMQPESATTLAKRVDLMGRQGRWQDAVTDAALVLKYQPAEHYRYHTLAALLVETRNIPGYEQLCQTILTTFTNTTNPYVAERMADDCLLMQNPGLDLSAADHLADAAVRLGGGDDLLPYIQACKAMADYRLGRFAEAVEWAEKSINGSQVYAQAKACAVQAMADWQLGKEDMARSMLAKGNMLAPDLLPDHGDVDLGDTWVAWLFARTALDEANALIQASSTPAKAPTNIDQNGKMLVSKRSQ